MPRATSFLSILFADDTTYQVSADTIRELNRISNLELKKAEQWFQANYLTLHPKKTRYILFQGTRKKPAEDENLEIYLMGQQVTRVGEKEPEKAFKFLGLWIDERLDWQHHIRKTVAKTRQMTYSMMKLKRFISREHQTIIYRGLIKPIVEYGIAIWGHAINKELNKAHKKILRIINHEPKHAHVEPLLKQMNCLQLEDLYKQRVLASLFKVKEEQVPELLLGYCTWNPTESRRWYQIQLPVKRSQMDKMLPQEKQATVWNNFFQGQTIDLLELHVTCKTFNKKVKNHIISQYYDECELKVCFSCKQRLAAIEAK